ncbi:hypothetical protein [Rubritalea tangerina]|uniref:Uncharacterized protein n=1 Tax=Rubritalea tangerina TaxID=430798 RepID=A0ABW4ZAQ1_9BACT
MTRTLATPLLHVDTNYFTLLKYLTSSTSSMNAPYKELKRLLEQRLSVITDSSLRTSAPEKQLQLLQSISESITTWHNNYQAEIDPRLHHFLQQQSLQKALNFIDDEGLV